MAKPRYYIWCNSCDSKVEVCGPIWEGRLAKSRMSTEHLGCYEGWVCDSCADKRESGFSE